MLDPDLIAVLDIETALPITTEGMKYGARGVVIGIPVHEHWRSERGLEIAGRAISATTSISFPLRNALSKARTSSRFFG